MYGNLLVDYQVESKVLTGILTWFFHSKKKKKNIYTKQLFGPWHTEDDATMKKMLWKLINLFTINIWLI